LIRPHRPDTVSKETILRLKITRDQNRKTPG
jgi:hypothetical protein